MTLKFLTKKILLQKLRPLVQDMDSLILIIFVLLFDGVKSPSCRAFQNRYLLLLRRRMRHQDQKSSRCLLNEDDKVRVLSLIQHYLRWSIMLDTTFCSLIWLLHQQPNNDWAAANLAELAHHVMLATICNFKNQNRQCIHEH